MRNIYFKTITLLRVQKHLAKRAFWGHFDYHGGGSLLGVVSFMAPMNLKRTGKSSSSGWQLITMSNGKSYILYKTKLHPGPFKLHCKTTRNKGQTLDEVVSRTVVGDSKKLEICRLSFQFWQPEIFEFLTTRNIWVFDNLKDLNFWQPEIFECLQPEKFESWLQLEWGNQTCDCVKLKTFGSSVLKIFEI